MIRRRSSHAFSLSFLDCICCGFGAIILLFVITMGSQSQTISKTRERLQMVLQAHLATLAQYTQQKEELQKLAETQPAVQEELIKQESLRAMLDNLEAQINRHLAAREALVVEVDELQMEVGAFQKEPDMILPDVEPLPVGIPAGNNFIAVVIDTSGSMRDPFSAQIYPVVLRKIDEVLNAYPIVEGIQVLDADGRFIVGRSSQWMPDSPEVRNVIKAALRRYDIFSNSNPVPGIFRALRTLHQPDNPDMKMGIYIFGDEFTGTADDVIRRLDDMNPADENGSRAVTINAIGFPTAIRLGFSMQNTGVKYANLMREITHRHGGAFIALEDL